MQEANKLVATLSLVAAALAMTACSRRDERPVGQRADDAVAGAEQKTDRARADVRDATADARQAADDAGAKTKDATDDAGEKMKDAAASAGDKVKDAAITTAVNAELARAPNLSALKIDVDTSDGHVALHGTAPDPESRDRATALAAGVDGVVSVDNQLVVASRS